MPTDKDKFSITVNDSIANWMGNYLLDRLNEDHEKFLDNLINEEDRKLIFGEGTGEEPKGLISD